MQYIIGLFCTALEGVEFVVEQTALEQDFYEAALLAVAILRCSYSSSMVRYKFFMAGSVDRSPFMTHEEVLRGP